MAPTKMTIKDHPGRQVESSLRFERFLGSRDSPRGQSPWGKGRQLREAQEATTAAAEGGSEVVGSTASRMADGASSGAKVAISAEDPANVSPSVFPSF